MKFREYQNLKSHIIESESKNMLCVLVNEFGESNDIIDLQYSSHLSADGDDRYSVFILYREK